MTYVEKLLKKLQFYLDYPAFHIIITNRHETVSKIKDYKISTKPVTVLKPL